MKTFVSEASRMGKLFLLSLAVCAVLFFVVRVMPHSASVQGVGGVSMPSVPAANTPIKESPLCQITVGFASIDLCQSFQGVIQSVFFSPVVQAARMVFEATVRSITYTDPSITYGNTVIGDMSNTTLFAVDALLIVVILVTGIRMVYEQSAISWANFRETIPQVLLAFLLAQVSLKLTGALIDLNNALCGLFLSKAFALGNLLPTDSSPLDLFAAFLQFVTGIFFIILVVEASVRIPVVNVCAVLSSAGCFALAWRPTQRFGFLWLNTLLSCVFLQFFQVLCLLVGLELIRDLQGQANPSVYVVLLGGIALLFIAVALPWYFMRWAIQPVFNAVRGGEQAVEGVVRTATTVAGAV